MDLSPLGLLKTLIRKTPTILRALVWHLLGWTPTAKKWDVRWAVVVPLIRSFFHTSNADGDGDRARRNGPTVSELQRGSLVDPPIRGNQWIAKVTLPAPTTLSDDSKAVNQLKTQNIDQAQDIKGTTSQRSPSTAASHSADDPLTLLLTAVDALNIDGAKYQIPEMLPVGGEWSGYGPGVGSRARRPPGSEEEQYQHLVKDTTSPTTILYFHGGALFLMDPSTHRRPCVMLAKRTGGRCFAPRYRLSPGYSFPAALLDCFVAYLSLLAPPPGAVHEPVEARHIVFAGDSAGGLLALTLVQLLLHLRRQTPSSSSGASSDPLVYFHGRTIPISLPAGIACQSAWLDLTRCMPSIHANLMWDYLPPPSPTPPRVRPDELWPDPAPRGEFYCETRMMRHPLVSPLAATDWSEAPPLFLCIGEECLADENRALAQRVVRQGGIVRWREFEAMPHCFAMVLPQTSLAQRAQIMWAEFISQAVANKSSPAPDMEKSETASLKTDHSNIPTNEPAFKQAGVSKSNGGSTTSISTEGRWYAARGSEEHAVDVRRLLDMSDAEVDARVLKHMQQRHADWVAYQKGHGVMSISE